MEISELLCKASFLHINSGIDTFSPKTFQMISNSDSYSISGICN